MKVNMFKKEWEVKSITYKEKRELWQLSLNAFKDGTTDQEAYFQLLNKVEDISGLSEKDLEKLSMADIDALLQEIYSQYMGLEKKDS
ncbi:MAG: hypothetical protein GOVbin5663_9 [Prokaryotic dsDNA virus sp.]|nr:MAG: hypothetical protein GOVbin5663_9 [Prokaryotic dsDNA virus sp.]|tara:strand:- start:23385 stop:23645 length:261 start_codon:yes stop_codon:yes gene_type:complete